MGAPKSYRKNRTREHKLENTGERRAGKFHADAGHREHLDEVASLKEARRRKLIVEEGIDPKTGKLYTSILEHRKALEQYWTTITSGEMANIKGTIWHHIDPSPEGIHTGAIVTHPAGRKLVNA